MFFNTSLLLKLLIFSELPQLLISNFHSLFLSYKSLHEGMQEAASTLKITLSSQIPFYWRELSHNLYFKCVQKSSSQ